MLARKRPAEALEAATQRLRMLGADALTLAKCASLVEDTFPLAVLRRIAGTKFPVKPALRSLRRERLAWSERHRGMQFFHFAHSTVREAAYNLLEREERERARKKERTRT